LSEEDHLPPQNSGFVVRGSGSRVQGAGCRVQVQVQGSGLRIQGAVGLDIFGFREHRPWNQPCSTIPRSICIACPTTCLVPKPASRNPTPQTRERTGRPCAWNPPCCNRTRSKPSFRNPKPISDPKRTPPHIREFRDSGAPAVHSGARI